MTMISEGRERTQSLGAGTIVKIAQAILITGQSGGQAIGSGLQTSGYVINSVVVKVPVVSASGTPLYGYFQLSGNTAPGMWVGGTSNQRPYPGSGFVASGKGHFIGPGEQVKLEPLNLGQVYVAAETSGYPITYLVEMVQIQS